MNAEDLRERIPVSELIFSASRSRGPGGQNVNKVNTKVELRFNVVRSPFLSEEERIKVLTTLKNKINSDGELLIISQSERTQLMNKKKAEEKFYQLLASVLTEKRERQATSPTKASKIKRVENKKKRGIIKRLRKDTDVSDEMI